MNTKLEQAQDVFLDKINQICTTFGLNNIMAQLYSILYLSNKPLSLDDMVERLKISKGSASVNIRSLESLGAVRNVWVKGSRKDFYEAELDVKKLIATKVKGSVQKRVTEVSEMLNKFKEIVKSASDELSSEDKDLARIYAERIKKIEELNSMATMALGLVEKFL
ncbi:MAG: hypothetical protein WC515_07475 [Candidatus Omnitrophota bacterium]